MSLSKEIAQQNKVDLRAFERAINKPHNRRNLGEYSDCYVYMVMYHKSTTA